MQEETLSHRIALELRIFFRRARRLIGFRRMPPVLTRLSGVTVLTIVTLALIAKFAADFAHSGTMRPVFNHYGTAIFAAGWAVIIAGVVIFRGRRPLCLEWTLAYLAIIAAILNLLSALVAGIYFVARHFHIRLDRWTGWTLAGALLLLALVWAWRAGRNLWQQDGRFPGLRLAAILLLPMLFVPNQPLLMGPDTSWQRYDVWYAADMLLRGDREESAGDDFLRQADTEDTFYRQPSLMAHAMGGVLPSDGKHPQYFLLAAAPNASQDVFAKEVRSVQNLFDERFGTRGHSAVLINSWSTLDTVPLADSKNLAVALQEIGTQMKSDRDVLVLFLTSHGAPGFVSVELGDYPLNQITPDSLAKALDDANIKNRVLIISACHSGSFIPRLKNEDTLIMTAARADRTSFGCGNGREWTYFGDALFNHALREERSFVAAFDKANALISRWEIWRSLMLQKPSEPQISVGSHIAKLLDEMARDGQQADAGMLRHTIN